MIQAMPNKVHAVSDLGGRGETPWNPPGADSEAVGQRFESSRAHHLKSGSYWWGWKVAPGCSCRQVRRAPPGISPYAFPGAPCPAEKLSSRPSTPALGLKREG